MRAPENNLLKMRECLQLEARFGMDSGEKATCPPEFLLRNRLSPAGIGIWGLTEPGNSVLFFPSWCQTQVAGFFHFSKHRDILFK